MKFENDSKSTRRPSSNLNQHHQTRLDRCNCRCCDLMVHSSTCLSLLLVVSSFSVFRSLLRFRFNSIKPALQLATPAGASSRKLRVQFVSYLTSLPFLTPDINPDRCSEPPSRCFPSACCNVSRSDNDGMPSSCGDFVRKEAEIHGFVKFLTKRLDYIAVQVVSTAKISWQDSLKLLVNEGTFSTAWHTCNLQYITIFS